MSTGHGRQPRAGMRGAPWALLSKDSAVVARLQGPQPQLLPTWKEVQRGKGKAGHGQLAGGEAVQRPRLLQAGCDGLKKRRRAVAQLAEACQHPAGQAQQHGKGSSLAKARWERCLRAGGLGVVGPCLGGHPRLPVAAPAAGCPATRSTMGARLPAAAGASPASPGRIARPQLLHPGEQEATGRRQQARVAMPQLPTGPDSCTQLAAAQPAGPAP